MGRTSEAAPAHDQEVLLHLTVSSQCVPVFLQLAFVLSFDKRSISRSPPCPVSHVMGCGYKIIVTLSSLF